MDSAEEVNYQKKSKKHKKHKKKKHLEKFENTEKDETLMSEEKINNMNLNILGEPEKPEPVEKLASRKTERGLLPVFEEVDDSGTDNMPTPGSRQREFEPTQVQASIARSPASMAWTPRQAQNFLEVEDKGKKHTMLQKRISREIQRYESSDSEEERASRFLKLKKKKRKKVSRDMESD